MRVAFLVPHFFGSGTPGSVHGSHRANARAIRRSVLDRVIFQLHSLFGTQHHALDMRNSVWVKANQGKSTVATFPSPNPYQLEFDIFVFTTKGRHLLAELECGDTLYRHVPTDADPMFLGFECARWIRDNPGRYDFYCYLEDDIFIRDPLFFHKIRVFNETFDAGARRLILQPQRYEESINTGDRDLIGAIKRIYIDYQATSRPSFEGETLTLNYGGVAAELEPALNPHAGCYVINDAQVALMTQHPDFLNRDKIDITPLDTAATSFVARALKVYKPSRKSLAFLDVQHGHQGVMWLKYDS
jgi:hypothetical protein